MSAPSEDREVFLASVLVAIVGVGYLFPFSALTQPVDFWELVFPDFNIEFPLTTLYMWVNLIFLALIVFATKKPSYTFRIVGGFVGQTLVLIAVPSLYFLHLDEITYYYLIMAATGFAAIVTALVDSVAIGFAAHYPLRVQEGLQFGIGLSTLIGSIYRIFTKLVFPVDQVVTSSLLYFYAGALTIIFCIFMFYKLLDMRISQHYFYRVQSPESQIQTSYGSMESYGVELSQTDNESSALLAKQNAALFADREACRSIGIDEYIPQHIDEQLKQEQQHHESMKNQSLLQRVAFQEFFVFVCFASTLLLWPPLVTEIPSYNFPFLQESRWWSLLLLLLFAIMDCLGRLLTPYRMGLNSGNIHYAVLARLVLIPMLICSVKQVYFTHDFFSVLFVGLLGYTNGYVGSLAVMMVSEGVSAEEKGQAGAYTGFFLNLGLVIGATAAMILKSWLDSW
jgi:solute carrier family 29 (equilibrative nucleoside transporter), member 1/2/3